MEQEQKATTFDHINVTGIDPGRAPLPEGPGYTFELVDAQIKTYGDGTQERLSLGFSIVNDPTGKLAGRMTYPTLFPGDKNTQDKLDRLAAQAGIRQSEPGKAGFMQWLEALRAARPRFTGEIRGYTKKSGERETEVNLFS